MADPTPATPPATVPSPYPAMELRPGTSITYEGGYNRLRVCRHGLILYNRNDLYVGRSLDLYGEFSEGEVDTFRQLLRPGDAVIEVGANIGAHTLFLAKTVGVEGSVLAFEPQRIIYQTLCANMALNNILHVHCMHLAVGEKEGTIHVPYLDPNRTNNFGGLGLGTYTKGDLVRVVTLDSYNIPRCRLIKVDVEGMEINVLKGAVETLKRTKAALYVENDRADRSDELIRFIDSIGYNMYWHEPPLYHRDNLLQNPENVFAGTISRNMLCLHRDAKQVIDGLKAVEIPK